MPRLKGPRVKDLSWNLRILKKIWPSSFINDYYDDFSIADVMESIINPTNLFSSTWRKCLELTNRPVPIILLVLCSVNIPIWTLLGTHGCHRWHSYKQIILDMCFLHHLTVILTIHWYSGSMAIVSLLQRAGRILLRSPPFLLRVLIPTILLQNLCNTVHRSAALLNGIQLYRGVRFSRPVPAL